MAVFISNKLESISNEVIKLQWHPAESLMAIALYTPNDSGEVVVLDSAGERVQGSPISRPHMVSTVAWHPLKPVLCIGWSSGCISFLNVPENNLVDIKQAMQAHIISIVWSSKGTKMISTDAYGTVCVWRQTALGDMQQKPVFTLSVDSLITCAVLLHVAAHKSKEPDLSALTSAVIKGDEKVPELLNPLKSPGLNHTAFEVYESSTFLVGCGDGRVLRISGDGSAGSASSENGASRLTTLASCEGGILNILCHPTDGNMIVITDKGMLCHYQLLPPNGASSREITKMKLAVDVPRSPSLTWAGGNLLAMGLGESVVRLWDIDRSDNYTLTPNFSDCDVSSKSVRVLQVTYSSKHQILAAGLSNGMVAFWQYGTEVSNMHDLSQLLQSDPTWTGDHNVSDEGWLVKDEDAVFGESDYLNGDNLANRASLTNPDKGPESNWHIQPTAILVNRPEEEYTTGLSETNRHVHLLAWDGTEDRLVIAVSARPPGETTSFAHGFAPKSAAYLLERQPLCGGFSCGGCAVVQTGPRSLAMLTSTQINSVDPGLQFKSASNQDNLNPLSTPQTTGLTASFIATSTAFLSGGSQVNNRKMDLLRDEAPAAPLIREHEAQVEDQIRALYCTQEYVTYWNGQRISTFRHATGDCIVHFASFPCEFRLIGMYEQSLFTVEPYKLQVRNLQGTVKQLINFTEQEGTVVKSGQCANFMACLTDKDKLRIFDLSRREIKSLGPSKSLTELVMSTVLTPGNLTDTTKPNAENLMTASGALKELRISYIAVNRSGNAVSFSVELLSGGSVCKARWQYESRTDEQPLQSKLSDKSQRPQTEQKRSYTVNQWVPDSRIYVYYFEKDKLQFFDFCTNPAGKLWTLSPSKASIWTGRWPCRHYWDQYEPRLLVVEAASLSDRHPIFTVSSPPIEQAEKTIAMSTSDSQFFSKSDGAAQASSDSTSPISFVPVDSRSSSKMTEVQSKIQSQKPKLPSMIVSLFTSPEQPNILVQEHFFMALQHSALLGVEVPYYYFAVRCDLVYRIVSEQCQRRRDLATGNRRLVADAMDPIRGSELELSDTQPEANAAGDKAGEQNQTNTESEKQKAPADTKKSLGLKIHYINRRVMRDFVDLELTDPNTKEAMLSFSYYLTMGEMDAAFKAMKLIKSPAVWQNMARMCVSTCRLDVARVCLGKMGNAMAAMMVREARAREPEREAQAGELALQLGMPEEAERLFAQCGRWDLMIRLYQSLGQWEKALRIAATHYRISLRATHYAYAKELEAMGKIPQAIEHYIQSETHRFEVPRMLKSHPVMLEAFVNQHPDKSVQRWWAQTLEAEGRLDEAKNYYILAKDYLSLVRVLCCMGMESEAENLCNETGDPAACYHLARQMESNGNIDQAVRLFTRAKAYSSAIRLCKEHSKNDHLFSLAQLGRPEDMLEAAGHLEKYPNYASKAVILYHKAGHVGRAVELAFQTHQFAALQSVAGSLDERIDPALLKRCAQFFTQNNQYDRAVDVLAAGKHYWDALKLCGEYNVPVTEELVEKLTPPACSPNGGKKTSENLDDSERSSILIELGELCMAQGQYHLACKKFTQAGSRISAMKALLRSGDTDKIIFFANVSKQKEIYIMAANYLQTLEGWRSNVDTMRTIVQFYTRGRAPESLASFYEACAHAEIEDFGSYEKATGALTEAYKVLAKAVSANPPTDTSEMRIQKRLAQIKNKATMCKEFAEAQLLFAVDPLEAMRRCQTLLENTEPGDILRPGDIYAAMIREFAAKEKYQAALSCMEEMRDRLRDSNQSVTRYLDRDTLESIQRALNLPLFVTKNESEHRETPKDVSEVTSSPAFDDHIIDASVSDTSDENY
ncbi:unnamed protein product [Calicophoron daubneyi]|uniref:Intraflagellar transport protein 140 homolog n=1 Tax=Calicophoron daubneyi TaxID=300641 RepID=A0AAV2T6Q9_CALDB